MTFVIGLTGGIGSGKSTVADLFAKKGVTVIDTDQLARDVVAPGQAALKKIVEKFGKDILLANGHLNRSELRKIIFEHPEYRKWLESLLHPLIRTEMKNQAELAKSPYCIIVIPLLFETEPNPLINRVLTIDSPESEQIKRTTLRDNTTPESITSILKNQVTRNHRLEKTDDIIYNQGKIEELCPQVDKLHQLYLTLSKQ